MHSVLHLYAHLSMVYVTYRQMRAYTWNGTHLTNIDCGRARDLEFMPRKYLPRSHRNSRLERTRRRDSLTRSARRT